jgi:hypothetical protein
MANGKPGRPKGLPKTGGRKVGTVNKKATLIAAKLAETELSAASTVEAIRRGALYDIGKLFDAQGNLRPIHQLSEDERFCIAGVEVIIKNAEAGDGHTDRVHKIKVSDRARFVEMAAKYYGLLKERVEVDASDALIAALHAGRKRAAEARG